MKNQDPGLIQEMLDRFHGKRFGGKIRKIFHLWLLSPQDYTAKDEAMNEIWHDIPSSVSDSTYRSLEAVKVKLGMTRPLSRVFPVRRIAARAAAVALPVMLTAGIYFAYEGMPGETEWARIEVPYGETARYTLADGTGVHLNSGSVFEYPVKFRGRQRNVRLRGEGLFDVAPNKRNPFYIHTECMKAMVIGTEFNISCYVEQDYESVTVMSGQVNVHMADDKMYELTAGCRFSYCKSSFETAIEDLDAVSAASWIKNGFAFEGDTYKDIIAALQRKYGIRANIDPAVYTGTQYRIRFTNGEPLEQILEVVHQLAGIPYKFESGILTAGMDVEAATR